MSSSLHWLNDKHQGLCLPLIFWRKDRQEINKLPILYPICRYWLFFSNPPPYPPPFTPKPYYFPKLWLCHCIYKLCSCSISDSLSLSLSLICPQLCAVLPATPTFLCSILLYKKYNPIDPKPDGKRWSVNRRVLNKLSSSLEETEGWWVLGWVGGVIGAAGTGEVCLWEGLLWEKSGWWWWVSVSVCLGIIYQFYCFLVLLLAAIAPHLALLLLVNLALIPAAASLRSHYVQPKQLKVRSSGWTDERCDILLLTDDEFRVTGWTDASRHRYGFIFFSPCIPTLYPQPLLCILLPIPSCLILPLPEVIGPSCNRMCPVPYLILNHYLTI